MARKYICCGFSGKMLLAFRSYTYAGLSLELTQFPSQGDIEKKTLQAALMEEEYSHAEWVSVWLGPEVEDCKLAVSFIQTVASILREIETGDMDRTKYYTSKCPEGAQNGPALAKLLDQPWFTQTWVIQETVLANNAKMICRDDSVSWNTLVE